MSSEPSPGEPLRAFACLEGMEPLVLEELGTLLPAATVAAVRPGLVVLRDPALDPRIALAPPAHPAFARAEFTVWGEVAVGSPMAVADALAPGILEALEQGGEPPALHVWAQALDDRDARAEEAKAAEKALRRLLGGRVAQRIAAAEGAEVVDVVRVDAGSRGTGREGAAYVVGAHRRTALMSAYPGGQRRLKAREEAPSRAHLKLEEGLEWSGLPIQPGDVAADVGCAPGGWSFVLLERGLVVHGVDPTPAAPGVLAHERFVEHRGPVRAFRPEDVPRLRWLFCDMNGPPLAALGQLQRIIPRCRDLAGVFHTVKLSDDPPLSTLAQVRSALRDAGFDDVRVQHLYHNRDELTVVARRRGRQSAPRVI
ncbi:MAG TPA: SAM-dependent methyltransferase [Planctomycetota bacterium]|nr:SAM-dependent methyltransferase [Planctomycetota bacterium]